MQSLRIVQSGVSNGSSYDSAWTSCLRCYTDINEYLPKETLEWCHWKLLSYGVNMADIRMGDANGSGDRLHVEAYHMLRHAIHAHMASGQFPILGESHKPTGGYEGAIARDGVLKQVIMANAAYVQHVQSSGVPIQLPDVQDFAPQWPFLGDAPNDLGWLNDPVAE
jgi:hypothetical protein